MTSLKHLFFVLFLAASIVATPALAAMQGAADYRTSLVSGITSSATSFTVVSTSTPSGEALIQGAQYGIKLGGREYILGTLSSGKQFTSVTRGISLITGTTTGGTAEAWGRGTAVEITDAPLVLEILNKIAGRQFFDNVLRYTGISTTTLATNGSNLASVDYVNDVSFGAVGQANESTAGFVELATGAEAAASTQSGATTARLALPTAISTSTWNSATAGNVIPVTSVGGKIDDNFISTSTLFATSSVYALPGTIGHIGKNLQAFTSTGTSTFTVPTGVNRVSVWTCGAGGAAPNSDADGGGGGAGGCAFENVDVSATSTIQVFVGTGASAGISVSSWSTFGTNGFYNSGSGGGDGTDAAGGTGGAATGGDLNFPGQKGDDGITDAGHGGSCMFGFGGGVEQDGQGYCAGGGGGTTEGLGANGLVLVQW